MIIKRILKIIDYKKISKNRFYQETGLSNGFLDKVKDVGASKLEYILNTYSEINPEWLLLGVEPMFRPGYEPKDMNRIPFFKKNNLKEQRLSTLLKLATRKPYYTIPKFGSAVDFLIETESNTMAPKYLIGDILACSLISQITFIQWNEPYLIVTKEQGVLIRRIKEGNSSGYYTLVSDNIQHLPFEIPKDEILDIALIIGFIRLE